MADHIYEVSVVNPQICVASLVNKRPSRSHPIDPIEKLTEAVAKLSAKIENFETKRHNFVRVPSLCRNRKNCVIDQQVANVQNFVGLTADSRIKHEIVNSLASGRKLSRGNNPASLCWLRLWELRGYKYYETSPCPRPRILAQFPYRYQL